MCGSRMNSNESKPSAAEHQALTGGVRAQADAARHAAAMQNAASAANAL